MVSWLGAQGNGAPDNSCGLDWTRRQRVRTERRCRRADGQPARHAGGQRGNSDNYSARGETIKAKRVRVDTAILSLVSPDRFYNCTRAGGMIDSGEGVGPRAGRER